MPRLNTAAELWKELDTVGYIYDQPTAPGSTTVDVNASKGDTALPVADETGFTVGDLIRIGSGEELEVNEVEATAVGNITLMSELAYDQEVGAAVVEQVKVVMGHVAEGGVTAEMSEDTFEINASTSKQTLVTRTTGITQNISWPAILYSMENLAVAHGIDEVAGLSGAGTAVDPTVFRTIADDLNSLLNASVYFQGTLEDGTNLEVRGWTVRWSLDKSATFARNAVAELPIGGEVKTIEYRQWT